MYVSVFFFGVCAAGSVPVIGTVSVALDKAALASDAQLPERIVCTLRKVSDEVKLEGTLRIPNSASLIVL